MCELSYEELILLDNLLYLELNVEENETIEEIIYNILQNENLDELMENVGNCAIKTSKTQCINILKQISSNLRLRSLKIKNVDNYKNGMKFACFMNENGNVTVVFRGTSTSSEWKDNGKGVYEFETEEQLEALNFINSLSYNNITVTGHSKGGNKAQYVTILSSKISRCVSINGQGFSNEFIKKYNAEISQNKTKIICINAEYDYVSCLFNSISGKTIYIKTEIQFNPLYYHEAHILLDKHGKLRNETHKSIAATIMNEFSIDIISNLPEDIEKIIIDRVIDTIEIILCKKKDENDLFEMFDKILILDFYKNYNEKLFLYYVIVQFLLLPFLFWNEFIYMQETKSNRPLEEIIIIINLLGNKIIKKLDTTDKTQKVIIENLLKALNNLSNKLQKKI